MTSVVVVVDDVVVVVVVVAEETSGVPTARAAIIAIAANVRTAEPFIFEPFNGILKRVLTQSLKIL